MEIPTDGVPQQGHSAEEASASAGASQMTPSVFAGCEGAADRLPGRKVDSAGSVRPTSSPQLGFCGP
jgi:hypothetical protein